jgi:hypothetical protein
MSGSRFVTADPSAASQATDAAVAHRYGLVAFGQIRMKKIDGHRHVASIELRGCCNAA